jgi:hypothetical protein
MQSLPEKEQKQRAEMERKTNEGRVARSYSVSYDFDKKKTRQAHLGARLVD